MNNIFVVKLEVSANRGCIVLALCNIRDSISWYDEHFKDLQFSMKD